MGLELVAKLLVTAWEVLVLVIDGRKVMAKLLRHDVGDMRSGPVNM